MEDKIDIEIFEVIIFDNYGYKTFPLDLHTLSKIDFTGISIDNFELSIDKNDKKYDFTKLTSVKINPQTIYYKCMTKSILCKVLEYMLEVEKEVLLYKFKRCYYFRSD